MSGRNSTVIPCLRYRDAHAAIDWLCRTFGFERQLVVPDADGVAHAQLTFAGGMVMLGSARPNDYGNLMRMPDEVGGATQSVYVVTPDPDAIYNRTKAAGAKIEIDIRDEDYGGRGFTCRDLEGHVWSFGSYDPWREG